ncbi:MAG: hypothetical protein SV775_11440, partial [Thermodesulfobacteriota bacterium]|nr:hypothetical protein [Thermodesulfobacteriota bacterium]
EFLDSGGWHDDASESKSLRNRGRKQEPGTKQSETVPKMTKKEIRQKRSEVMAEKAKALKWIESRIKELENNIEIHEKELERLNSELIKASEEKNGMQIKKLSQLSHASQDLIENHFAELEKLYEKKEKEAARFEKKLNEWASFSKRDIGYR